MLLLHSDLTTVLCCFIRVLTHLFRILQIGNRNLKKVVDKCCGSPVFVPGPLHDLDLECDDEIPPAANDCLGACGKSIAYDCAFFDATPDTESCSDTVYRFYTGANEVRLKDGTFTCEEYNEVEQRITVTDTTPPVMTTPDDVTIECTEDVPVPDLNTVSAIDNCQSNVFITHEGDVADRNGQACPRTITRTFRATDGCGNYVEDTQTITVLERA